MTNAAQMCWLQCLLDLQGRKLAESAESTRRMDRLTLQAGGGSMVTTTTTTMATMDGDDEEDALRRFNIILKVLLLPFLAMPSF